MAERWVIHPSQAYRDSKFRDGDMLRHIFETTFERCLKQDLVPGESFAVDASLIPRMPAARSIAAKDWSEDVARPVGTLPSYKTSESPSRVWTHSQ